MNTISQDNEKVYKRQSYVFEGGLNESASGAEDSDMDPDEFAAEMELEKTKLRKEACRSYIVGAVASFCLYGLFWVIVTAQNTE